VPSKPATQIEPLSYDIAESCRVDDICRSLKYRAIDPDPAKRGGLPYLPTFKVGRRRLMMAADHRAWLEALRTASTSAADAAV
jgi:hypothetical protein